MSAPLNTINLAKWIEENRSLLKPPVGNKAIYDEDFIVMVVGGANQRKDYHLNQTPEFFYQVEGNVLLKIMVDGKPVDIHIKEGEVYFLPSNIPHLPIRNANTVGLVIEQKRAKGMEDGLAWFCENCNHELYRESFTLKNIETDMQRIFKRYYSNLALRTCDKCGIIMAPPE